ncbi:MAG: biotin/lipoyl-containing protein [Bacteroidota bacterium]|nr:biotin/lipoyl-containing protein [Bacteroidota bacterium]
MSSEEEKVENTENTDNTEYTEFEILNIDSILYKTTLTKKFRNRKVFKDLEREKVTAFISGTVRKVYVKKGKKVKEGDKLLILEAMKMRNVIKSPMQGRIKNIYVEKDKRVAKDQLLIEIE